MTYIATDYSHDYDVSVREDGFHGIQDSLDDWAIASDECGENIYCERSVAEFMGRDAH